MIVYGKMDTACQMVKTDFLNSVISITVLKKIGVELKGKYNIIHYVYSHA
jgi:hypothetical protein